MEHPLLRSLAGLAAAHTDLAATVMKGQEKYQEHWGWRMNCHLIDSWDLFFSGHRGTTTINKTNSKTKRKQKTTTKKFQPTT